MALEGTAAAHAYRALYAGPGPLREALSGMREAAATKDAHGLAKYCTEFHRAVVAASGNRLMMEIWDSLFVEARTMATVVRGHVDLHAAAEAHVPILEAFETGSPELCTRLVIEHQHEYSGYAHELEVACKAIQEMRRRGIRVLPGGDYGFAWTPTAPTPATLSTSSSSSATRDGSHHCGHSTQRGTVPEARRARQGAARILCRPDPG
nr:FCD domain-containing protein [Arthrobacter sp. PAMC25564]